MSFVSPKDGRLRDMPHCRPALPKKPFPPAEIGPESQFTTPIHCTSLSVVIYSDLKLSLLYGKDLV